jgi:hypothetical protein
MANFEIVLFIGITVNNGWGLIYLMDGGAERKLGDVPWELCFVECADLSALLESGHQSPRNFPYALLRKPRQVAA